MPAISGRKKRWQYRVGKLVRFRVRNKGRQFQAGTKCQQVRASKAFRQVRAGNNVSLFGWEKNCQKKRQLLANLQVCKNRILNGL